MLSIMVIHGPIAVNNYWTLMIFKAMVLNFITFLSLIHFVDKPEKYDRLVKIWLGIHIFLAFIGIVKKGTGIGGFLGDENDLCMTLNMIIPFTLFLSLSRGNNKSRIYYILISSLFLFVIILTQSRGGFVGLLSVAIYCWLKSKKKFMLGLSFLILIFFALLVAPSSYWGEVRSIREENTQQNPYGTGAARIYVWKVGWEMFLDNPVLGVGQGNFPWVFHTYEGKLGLSEGFDERSMAGRAAHSIYFAVMAELGIVGTLLFAAMILYTLKDLQYIQKVAINKKDVFTVEESTKYYNLGLALEGSLIAYLVSGIFISILYYPNLWIIMGFVISLKRILYARCGDLQPVKFSSW
jgi:probable O-glycosylation ligase (exosortase A-associated)